jgi:hypothetical protein
MTFPSVETARRYLMFFVGRNGVTVVIKQYVPVVLKKVPF